MRAREIMKMINGEDTAGRWRTTLKKAELVRSPQL